jgi:hypothetical protein
MAAAALRRKPLEVGAVCPNWARTDLMRGREVTRVPTAKVTGEPYAIEPLQKSRRIDLLPLPDREEPKVHG